MHIQILSDLHLEFGSFHTPENRRDLLILAGDIGVGPSAEMFLQTEAQVSPVIYVLGNHEFYHHDFHKVLNFWKSYSLPNLHFLENSAVVLNGVRFLGCTLWTDFRDDQGEVSDAIEGAQGMMNDYIIVTFNKRRLTPRDTINMCQESIRWLGEQLRTPFAGPSVVVTHHLPSFQSIAPEYEGDPLNYAFGSNFTPLIEETQPALWIHGHTHVSFDYYIKNTRVLCNPRGYADGPNPGFQSNLTVTI